MLASPRLPDTLVSSLPPVYKDLLSPELEKPAVKETRADCANCQMCNQGTMPSYGSEVELRISVDEAVTPDDVMAGGAPLPSLEPGACATVTIGTSVYVPEGAYYLGAVADPMSWVGELVEDNNATTGTRLGVGHVMQDGFEP